MEEEKLILFLKGYADVLREAREDWKPLRAYSPLASRCDMPGGCIVIEGRWGQQLASISVRHGPEGEEIPWDCSMPVGPFDMAFADLFVKVANVVLMESESGPV